MITIADLLVPLNDATNTPSLNLSSKNCFICVK